MLSLKLLGKNNKYPVERKIYSSLPDITVKTYDYLNKDSQKDETKSTSASSQSFDSFKDQKQY